MQLIAHTNLEPVILVVRHAEGANCPIRNRANGQDFQNTRPAKETHVPSLDTGMQMESLKPPANHLGSTVSPLRRVSSCHVLIGPLPTYATGLRKEGLSARSQSKKSQYIKTGITFLLRRKARGGEKPVQSRTLPLQAFNVHAATRLSIGVKGALLAFPGGVPLLVIEGGLIDQVLVEGDVVHVADQQGAEHNDVQGHLAQEAVLLVHKANTGG